MVLLVLSFLNSEAQNYRFGWNPNPITDNVVEYRMFKVVDHDLILIGSTPDTTIVISGLSVGDVVGIKAVNNIGLISRLSKTVTIPPPSPYTTTFVSSEEPTNPAFNIFDSNNETFWSSKSSITFPHEIHVDLKKEYDVNGMIYIPRQDGELFGNIGQFNIFVSVDGINWGEIAGSGSFSNTNTEKTFTMTPKRGRYVRLVILNSANGDINLATIAELRYLLIEILPDVPPEPPSGLTIQEVNLE